MFNVIVFIISCRLCGVPFRLLDSLQYLMDVFGEWEGQEVLDPQEPTMFEQLLSEFEIPEINHEVELRKTPREG